MNVEFDPYDILGVSPSSSDEEIKNAYRRIARRLHPDANPRHPGAHSQFQDVSVAYELLSDLSQRREYDQKRQAHRSQGTKYFTLRVTPSRRRLPVMHEPQVIYLLAEIFPDPSASEENTPKHETHLNLTLVLDQSNSMSGVRMEKVKVAAHQIIDNLTENDILSVVSFNDRANIVIPAAPVKDKPAMKARISMMQASGGTEIYQGLSAGVDQNRRYLGPHLVNHIILLTDGRTYGDQPQCIDIAGKAAAEGISISAMGLGNDWNDEFLDQIAAKTGGNSAYINTAGAVVRFLNDHVKHLSNAFAERVYLSIAPDSDIDIESVFKLSPSPQPVELVNGEIPLGSLLVNRPISVLMQLQIPANQPVGFRSIIRMVTRGDILENKQQKFLAVSDLSLEVKDGDVAEEPPDDILDALSKLTLYRLQERANEALAKGDIAEATRRLEHLATRLLEMGHSQLANETLSEAKRIVHTRGLSEEARKTIKYQTRFLLSSNNDDHRNNS